MIKGMQTLIDNLKKNTGKSLEEWVSIVKTKNFSRHGEIMKFLKEEHLLTHGYANLVALSSKGSLIDTEEKGGEAIDAQYKGKENLRPVYDKLLAKILKFGKDIEVAPKNSYVSLRRKKQFAMLIPATKSRFEVGLNLKGKKGKGILEEVKAANSMCSHKIRLENSGEITDEVIELIKEAYEGAG
jgi:predicted transport protein